MDGINEWVCCLFVYFFLFDSGYATSGAMPYHSLRPLHLIEVIFVLFRMNFMQDNKPVNHNKESTTKSMTIPKFICVSDRLRNVEFIVWLNLIKNLHLVIVVMVVVVYVCVFASCWCSHCYFYWHFIIFDVDVDFFSSLFDGVSVIVVGIVVGIIFVLVGVVVPWCCWYFWGFFVFCVFSVSLAFSSYYCCCSMIITSFYYLFISATKCVCLFLFWMWHSRNVVVVFKQIRIFCVHTHIRWHS